jgi:hypothetical protein
MCFSITFIPKDKTSEKFSSGSFGEFFLFKVEVGHPNSDLAHFLLREQWSPNEKPKNALFSF